MKKTCPLICFLFCFISFSDCHQKNIDKRPKKIQSEEKLKLVVTLVDKLQRKKSTLDQKGQIFEQEITVNIQEIKIERDRGTFTDFRSAMSNKHIENCLNAIQKASAYKELVNREAQKTEASVIELEGTTKQLRLDITVLGALEDEKGDELLAELDLVINRIQPQADDLVISPDTPKKPLEEIFNKYIIQSGNQNNPPAQLPESKIVPTAKNESRFSSISIDSPLQPDYTLNRSPSSFISWSPDDTLLALRYISDVDVWDYTSNSIVTLNNPNIPTSIIWSVDGTNLILSSWLPSCKHCSITSFTTCGKDDCNSFYFWTVAVNRMTRKIEFPIQICDHQLYENHGNYLVVKTCDNYLFFDYKQGQFVKTIYESSGIVWRDGNSFFYNDTRTLYLYDLVTGQTETLFDLCIVESSKISSRQCPKSISEIAWNNVNTLAVSMTFTHSVKGDYNVISFFNTSKRAKTGTVEVTSVRQLWWQNDNDLMYFHSHDLLTKINNQSLTFSDTRHLWRDNATVRVINNDKYPRFFVVVGFNCPSFIKDNKTFDGQNIFLATQGQLSTVSWSNNGKMLAAISDRNELYVWNLNDFIN